MLLIELRDAQNETQTQTERIRDRNMQVGKR